MRGGFLLVAAVATATLTAVVVTEAALRDARTQRGPPVPPWRRNVSRPDPLRPAMAYGIIVHNMGSARCAAALVARLWAPEHLFILHIDITAPPEVRQYLHATLNSTVVYISKRNGARFSYGLGMIGVDLMEAAVRTDVPWLYLQLLSGDTYPTMSGRRLVSTYQRLYPTNLLFETYLRENMSTRVNKWKTTKRVPKDWKGYAMGAQLLWGTQWVAVTREAAEYVVYAPRALQLRTAFADVQGTDEGMVHAILAERFPRLVETTPALSEELGGVRLYVRWRRGRCRWESKKRQACLEGADIESLFTADQGRVPMFARKIRDDALRKLIDSHIAGDSAAHVPHLNS
eukprot:m51a1_g1531 hypothetical protein (345) ;mRNA; f:512808-513997